MQLVTQGYILEHGTATLLARILFWDGRLVTADQVQAIEYTAYIQTDVRTIIPGYENVPIENAIFDSLQRDDRWTRDEIGYNFRHTITASATIDGAEHPLASRAGDQIVVAVKLTPVIGEPIRWDYVLDVL